MTKKNQKFQPGVQTNAIAGAPSLFDDATPPSAQGASGRPKAPALSPLRPDGQYACAICGAPANFGFDVKLLAGRIGRWACRDHIENVKHMRR